MIRNLQKLFTIESKLLVYKTMTLLVKYSSKIWVLSEKNCKLATFERRIFPYRKMDDSAAYIAMKFMNYTTPDCIV